MRGLRQVLLIVVYIAVLGGGFAPARAQEERAFKNWRLLSWAADHTVRLWDVESSEELFRIQHEDSIVEAVMLDDSHILSYTSHFLDVSDVTTRTRRYAIQKSTSTITDVIMLPDTRLLIYSVHDGDEIRTIELADSTSGEILQTIPEVEAFFALPDGRFLIKTLRHRAQLWNDTLTEPLFTFEATPSVQFSELYLFADGRLLSRQAADFVRIWDGQTGEQLMILSPPSRFDATYPAPDGNLLTTSWDDGVIVWDSHTGKQLINFHLDNELDWEADFLTDGRIRTTGIEGRVQLWDAHTGELLVTMRHDEHISDMSELPDHRLLTASYDGTVRLWDGQTPQPLLVLRHPSTVYGTSWLESGHILSRGADGVVRLWDATTGAQVRQFHHDDYLYGAVVWVAP